MDRAVSAPRRDFQSLIRTLGFERLESRLLLATDFGDAPLPYATLLAENGARHEAVGPSLGTLRDTEANGVHSALADADGADEDGVSFGTIRVGDLGAAVTVNVQGGAAKLDAWIDFDGDGNWGGPFEQIADSLSVVVGNNVVMFDVPSGAIDGATYARFRLSTAGNLGVGGMALDGEVEDYRVTMVPPTIATGIFGPQKIISTSADSPVNLYAADIDSDGDMDVLSASINDDEIAWYENNGAQSFTAHTITTAVNQPDSVFAVDVDGDGDLDVLSASFLDDKIAWYENDGTPAVGTWTARTIATGTSGYWSVYAADVDGDGDMDVLSSSILGNLIAWHQNDGTPLVGPWTTHTIATGAQSAVSVHAADIDDDGDLDVVSASKGDDKIAWYENDGTPAVGAWTARSITTAADNAHSVHTADVDGDGDVDVLSASYGDDKIAWYENDGTPAVGTWTAHTITTAANGARSVYAADLDGDGDMDVVSASIEDDRIAWYKNNGSQVFTIQTISTAADFANYAYATDMDGDGDIDVLSASIADDKIAWYENTPADYGDAPASYPTLVAENGARHGAFGPTLGVLRDTETNGAHSALADADGADEDGVVFGTIRVGDLGATLTVNVQGGAAKLDAWIDFDGDGNWGGPAEQIADSLSVAAGFNVFTFDVPSSAIDGATYARFRLSTAGNLGVGGLAADGEVEDYRITIAAPVTSHGVLGPQNTISTTADGAQSVHSADIDGDGDMDVLSASLSDDEIIWYENDGTPLVGAWTAYTITAAANQARDVFAADIDGDGDMDVLSASFYDDKIAWYENDGTPAVGAWTARTITTAANGAIGVYAADVDGDGDIDVLSASYADDKIAWYENDGTPLVGAWTANTITTAANGAIAVYAADMDRDGDLDILSASAADNKIAWYENNGAQSFTAHTITTALNRAWSVHAADLDGDGDMDVLSASQYDDRIAWYENDGTPAVGAWTARDISTAADGAMSVYAADLDGDGDMDVLSASRFDDKIANYINDGTPGNGGWIARTVTTAANAAHSVFAADVDGDGDLDVLSASDYDDRIAWYSNVPPDFGDAPTPYPTLLSENGARHLATGPTLGSVRDSENDGTHSANADADGADEDGVVFGTIRVGDLGATLTVNVQGGPAKLDAWIDFDGDGNWGGPFEQIADSVTVVIGNNVITFDVPSSAVDGVTFARFRLSSAGNLGVGGLAQDGEVEDYAVTIIPPAPASGVFLAHGINSTVHTASRAYSVDLDGDGDMDVLSSSSGDNTIAWFENDGTPAVGAWAMHTITTSADFATGVFAADIDGDGDLDVLSASNNDDKIAWYENDGTPAVGAWTARNITLAAQSANAVYAADIDGDGDVDVLSAARYGDHIAWYENDGTPAVGPWTAHTITNSLIMGGFVYTNDIDGDGDLDVLSASSGDNKIAWYENDGTPAVGPWTAYTITTSADDAHWVHAADLDGDGDSDVLSASPHDDKIAWYENDGTPTNGGWNTHIITTANDNAHSVFAADIDGDGDMDVIASAYTTNNVAWYENDGTPAAGPWNARILAAGFLLASSVHAADVDGDGDLDILSSAHNNTEIIWWENLPPDFGDAPAPYPTLLAEDGARHHPHGPQLGSSRDTETDGAHSALADADGADEDGVTFGAIKVGQLGATLTVNVQNAPSGAKLDAWIDFDGDGNWGGPFEQIADSLSVVNGNNVVTFDVPSSAIDGATYARFRLSTAGNLAVDGVANDGEVEDYRLTIARPTAAHGTFGGQNVISTAAREAYSVFSADIDGDGDMDVLSASQLDDKIAWYENNGAQSFTARNVNTPDPDSNPNNPINGDANRAQSVFAADIDGDGDLDVLSASLSDSKIAWYENDGTPGVGPWTARAITTAAVAATSVYAADVDGDGDLDVVFAAAGTDEIAWSENDGTPANGGWTYHSITTSADVAFSVYAADMDRDGDMDILSASLFDSKIAWYENNGAQVFTAHNITTTAAGARSAHAADVDGDGDMDVLSASENDDTIAWYENDGTPAVGAWTARAISTTADVARDVYAADVDGDGDMDVVSASYYIGSIAWYENDGTPAVGAWTARTIFDAPTTVQSIHAADVDGDGDLDVLSASLLDNTIAWYENRLIPGDYDRDGDVDQADYDFWYLHQGESSPPGTQADGNGDGTVNAADYVIWRKFEPVYGGAPDASAAPANLAMQATAHSSFAERPQSIAPAGTAPIEVSDFHSIVTPASINTTKEALSSTGAGALTNLSPPQFHLELAASPSTRARVVDRVVQQWRLYRTESAALPHLIARTTTPPRFGELPPVVQPASEETIELRAIDAAFDKFGNAPTCLLDKPGTTSSSWTTDSL